MEIAHSLMYQGEPIRQVSLFGPFFEFRDAILLPKPRWTADVYLIDHFPAIILLCTRVSPVNVWVPTIIKPLNYEDRQLPPLVVATSFLPLSVLQPFLLLLLT
jgi:hypothetical protein